MTPRRLLSCLLLLVATLPATFAVPAALGATAKPPNIVLLIGDDHGWPYSGFMGDPFARTPNLDALAAGGTLFTNAQGTSSVCVPSLRALLAAIHTDQWDAHSAAVHALQGPQGVQTEVAYTKTVPRALAWEGYVSWEGGKLWEGTFALAGFTDGMATSLSNDPFSSVGDRFGRTGWHDGTALDPLRAFLDTTGGKPFFTWIAPLLPHTPLDAPQGLKDLYANMGLRWWEVGYYANVSWLDALIGSIVAELDARGLRDDTLIVYLSDNGIGIDQAAVGTGQGKGTLAELGFRTPLIFNWPGHVPAGAVRDDLVSELDVPATILDYAGAEPIPAGGGRSLKDAVESGVAVGRDKIVSHYGGTTPATNGFYVRTPSWRYISAADGTEKIYAIVSDPLEEFDVAALHPELLPLFRADVAAWRADIASAPDALEAAGRLTDEAGAPLGGEQLQLVGRSTAGIKYRLRVLTGPSGDFRFVALPQGSYTLTGRRHFALRLGRYISRAISVPLPFGGVDNYLPLAATPTGVPGAAGAATIRGVLRLPSGQPLTERTVIARKHGKGAVALAVLTAADGRYRLDNLPPGTYSVAAVGGPHLSRAKGRVQVAANGAATLDLTAIAR